MTQLALQNADSFDTFKQKKFQYFFPTSADLIILTEGYSWVMLLKYE